MQYDIIIISLFSFNIIFYILIKFWRASIGEFNKV